jgi:predicted deacetylase
MLVVTIHDVTPPTLPAVTALRELASRWGVARATLLAVPDFHGIAPLATHAPTIAWLRRCADAGDEIALHGLRHAQVGPAAGLDALRARWFTAGEAEMLGAGAGAPGALARERDRLGALVRAPIHGFVAPAWLEPRGFGDVLARLAFRWHETGERFAGRDTPARVALHPGDLANRSVLAAAERTIRRLVEAHAAVTTAVALGVALPGP